MIQIQPSKWTQISRTNKFSSQQKVTEKDIKESQLLKFDG